MFATDKNYPSPATVVVNHARIDSDPAAVFECLANVENEQEWNDKLLELRPVTGGPLHAGSQFKARFPWPVGESLITYDDVDEPYGWRTHSTARRLHVQLVGSITDNAGCSEVTLTTALRPRGLLRLLRPVLARTMKASWDSHLLTIKSNLETRS